MLPLTSGRRRRRLRKLEGLQVRTEGTGHLPFSPQDRPKAVLQNLSKQGRGQDTAKSSSQRWGPFPASTFLFPGWGRKVIGNNPRIPLLLLLGFWFLLFRRRKTQTHMSAMPTKLHPSRPAPGLLPPQEAAAAGSSASAGISRASPASWLLS